MTTITLDLPQVIYRRAQRVAQATKRPVEQVVMEWIQPPAEDKITDLQKLLADLESFDDAELQQIVRSGIPAQDATRLQTLLHLQQQRPLTFAERHEAEQLVAQEDGYTLRKAKALFFLKQRGMTPANLQLLLAE